MFQEFLSRSPLTIWPLLAFILFFGVFVTVCVVLAVGAIRKKNFDDVARLPLEDEGTTPAQGGAR